MEQKTVSQYDDDLTVGIEETEEFLDTGFVDLFEYSNNNGSPISRLKTIVLSLDWEINDEVLTQFNDELNVLKDVWADDQVKLVYIQALEKLSKYIYQKRAEAHPTAIKLLLTFYYNLEKVVLDEELTDAEIKNILKEDVQRFEQLKQQIGSVPKTDETKEQDRPETGLPPAKTGQTEARPVLFNLKACILGMDWEITERELNDLSREIAHLEGEFAGRKPHMIFLQGISALGGYIKLKKSDAHADAFKLLYSFYESLEKIVINPELTKDEVKDILLPEVEKFEDFKQIIASTITPEALAEKVEEEQPADYEQDGENSVSPAFADVPEEEVQGFQAEEEAASLGDPAAEVDATLDTFLADKESEPETIDRAAILPPEALEKIDSFFGDDIVDDALAASAISTEDALKGVEVETDADDDSEEEALPIQDDGMLAPALADSGEDDSHGFNPDPAIEPVSGEMFVEEDATAAVSKAAALQGVNVETDADDVSGELPLPQENEDIAPALASEESVFDTIEDEQEEITSELDDQIKGFFGEDQIEENIFADDGLAPDVSENNESEAVTGDDGSEELSDGFESRLDSFFPEMDEEITPVSDSGELVEDNDGDVLFEVVDDDETITAEGEDLPYGIADDEGDAEPVSQGFDSMGDDEEVQSAFDAEVDELEAVLESEAEGVDEPFVPEFTGEPEESVMQGEAESEPAIGEEQIVSEPEGQDEAIEAQPETEPVDEERAPEFIGEPEEPVTELEFEAERVEDDVVSEFGGEAETPEAELETEAEREALVAEFAGEPEEPLTELDPEVETFDDEEQKTASEFSAEAVAAATTATAAATAAVSSFGSHSEEDDFFAGIDERVEEPGEIQMELLSETDELDHGMVPDHDESEENEIPSDTEDVPEPEKIYSEGEQVAEEEDDQPLLFAVGDELSELRAGVASLGVEINDSIIQGLLSEINHLRHRMMTKPVEKTFLQLMSTIVQHIGHYRYESSSDAHTLVLSVFDKLELTHNSEIEQEQVQEILLAETCKVLLWQQKMLDRQAVQPSHEHNAIPALSRSAQSGENNGFQPAVDQGDEHGSLDAEPVEQKDFSAVFEPVDEDDFVTSEEIQAAQEEQELEMGDTFADDSGDLLPDGVDDEKLDVKGFSAVLSNIVRREMKALKDLLRTELRALKDKLKDKEK